MRARRRLRFYATEPGWMDGWMDGCAGGKHTRTTRRAADTAPRIYLCLRHAVKVRVSGGSGTVISLSGPKCQCNAQSACLPGALLCLPAGTALVVNTSPVHIPAIRTRSEIDIRLLLY